jgi:hypothetical protein
VLPVRHYGSVDVFLEAFGRAQAGDVPVIDNGGRSDEACAREPAERATEQDVSGRHLGLRWWTRARADG